MLRFLAIFHYVEKARRVPPCPSGFGQSPYAHHGSIWSARKKELLNEAQPADTPNG